MTLQDLNQILKNAGQAEEVFGELAGNKKKALRKKFAFFANICHPDHNVKFKEVATEAFQNLKKWLEFAEGKVKRETYGLKKVEEKFSSESNSNEISIFSEKNKYVIQEKSRVEDISDIHLALNKLGQTVEIKICRNTVNNNLLENEYKILQIINEKSDFSGRGEMERISCLVESFQAEVL